MASHILLFLIGRVNKALRHGRTLFPDGRGETTPTWTVCSCIIPHYYFVFFGNSSSGLIESLEFHSLYIKRQGTDPYHVQKVQALNNTYFHRNKLLLYLVPCVFSIEMVWFISKSPFTNPARFNNRVHCHPEQKVVAEAEASPPNICGLEERNHRNN